MVCTLLSLKSCKNFRGAMSLAAFMQTEDSIVIGFEVMEYLIIFISQVYDEDRKKERLP